MTHDFALDVGLVLLVVIVFILGSISDGIRRIVSELSIIKMEVGSATTDIEALRKQHAPLRIDYPN
ncbi:MAG: hypothetical protein ABSC72_11370 [Methylovirgula sp.]|jgi:succinyl-CoA synthetase alpha subunit